MKRSLMIHQAAVGLTALLIGALLFMPVSANTAFPTMAADSSPVSSPVEDITKSAKNNDVQKRAHAVPSQLGVCALELIKLEKGRIAVCTDTNLAYSGILLDCADLNGTKALSCEAAMRTMPNQGKRKPSTPASPTK